MKTTENVKLSVSNTAPYVVDPNGLYDGKKVTYDNGDIFIYVIMSLYVNFGTREANVVVSLAQYSAATDKWYSQDPKIYQNNTSNMMKIDDSDFVDGATGLPTIESNPNAVPTFEAWKALVLDSVITAWQQELETRI